MKYYPSINQIIIRDVKSQINIITKVFYKKNYRLKVWTDFLDLSASSNLYGTFLQSFLFYEELLLIKPTILKIKVKKNKKNRQKIYQAGFMITNLFQISKFFNYLFCVVLPLDLKYSKFTLSFVNNYLRLTIYNLNSFLGLQIWYFSLANTRFYIDFFFKQFNQTKADSQFKLINIILAKNYEGLFKIL